MWYYTGLNSELDICVQNWIVTETWNPYEKSTYYDRVDMMRWHLGTGLGTSFSGLLNGSCSGD